MFNFTFRLNVDNSFQINGIGQLQLKMKRKKWEKKELIRMRRTIRDKRDEILVLDTYFIVC